MPSPLRATLLLLLALTVLAAGLIRTSSGQADTALWNPYDPVGEVVPPASEPAQGMRAVEEYRGYVYLLGKSGTLYTYDTRDLPGLTTFARYGVPIASVNVGVHVMLLRNGTWLYACGDRGLAALDLANPARPLLRVLPDEVAGYYNMERNGERLYCAGRQQAVIYSLADASHPVVLGSYPTARGVYAATGYAGTMYLAEFSESGTSAVLRAVNVSDPAHPTLLGSQALPDYCYHLRVLNGQLISANDHSVCLFSLANPREPQLLDTQVTSGRVCAIDGGNVVLSVRAFRPSDNGLVQVGSWSTTQGQSDGAPYGSAVDSGYVFLGETKRALILKSAGAPEAWPYHLYLSVVRKG